MLRHPTRQHELQQLGALQESRQEAQRATAVLLSEMGTGGRPQAAAASPLVDQWRGELVPSLHEAAKQARATAGASSKAGSVRRQAASPSTSGPTLIRALQPPGGQQRQDAHTSAPRRGSQQRRSCEASSKPQQTGGRDDAASHSQEVQEALREREEMRAHLEALYAHCRRLQRQLERAPARQAPGCPQRQSALLQMLPPPAAAQAGGRESGGRPCSPASGRPPSPGRTAVLLAASPDAASLAVAVFEEAPEDAEGLRLALNRLQRSHLKLSSKLSKAQGEAADRAAEAWRWQEVVDQQAGAIAELRVQVESEGRKQRRLEDRLAEEQGWKEAARQDADALLAQLRAAEGAVAAAEGEASSLRCQLAASEGQLARALRDVGRLQGEAGSTGARLEATDTLRRQAEQGRDDLELAVQRLRADLAEAQASGGAAERELCAQLALARQELAVERQRAATLATQLQLAEVSGREAERQLGEELRAVQEERDVCLAAATRADKLLMRLGQHAMATRGGGD